MKKITKIKQVTEVTGMDLTCFKRYTVEPVLKDRPISHKNMASQDGWSLLTDLFTQKCRTCCQKLVVLQDRWPLMAVVSEHAEDRFHCTDNL